MRMVLIIVALACGLSAGTRAQEAPAASWQARAQSIVSALDYVAIDYPEAVQAGEIVNVDEYAEQLEFAATVRNLLQTLPAKPGRDALGDQARRLAAAIERRAPADEVAGLCRQLGADVIAAYAINVAPSAPPEPQSAQALYVRECSSCHGLDGRGGGPVAATLEPPPTDFHDAARARQRSLYGLFSTITLGVEGTGMVSFSRLAPAERWNLAFYVAGLGDERARVARGRELWNAGKYRDALGTLAALSSRTPAEMEATRGGDAADMMAFLRHHPEVLAEMQSEPLERARNEIAQAGEAYAHGRPGAAAQLALTAYLEGYELVEAPLRALDSDLALGIERDMQAFRTLISEGAPTATVAAAAEALEGRLAAAAARLDDEGLSALTVFVSGLLILLREGLEAILLLAAIAMYLKRTGHARGMAFLHVGWVGALAAGLLTWLAALTLIDLSGAQREAVEGFAALLAAAVLLYVGMWLHRHSLAARWQAFLQQRIGRHLSAGTLWGIAGLAFIAVYREVFETLLFYQALWLQAARPGPLLAGAASASIALAVIAWLVFRIGARLPLRQFFRVNGVLMFALAVIFTGKGVAALQEAGMFPARLVDFPRIDLLGVYPTVQSLGAQLGCLLIGAVWLLRGRREPVTAGRD
ncbi:MAG TPA: cytochrome c/FTR1 family iron permease [Gammaproteobacteria bacterium]|nr:cytochrome c/FTR1 family iron permease [Gammaproteobacteria bacterium]